MKVSISTTVEVTDEQREMLARVLDGQGARKRKATRDEFRTYIWSHGEDWEITLSDQYAEESGTAAPTEEDEDLLGNDLTQEEADDEFGDLI